MAQFNSYRRGQCFHLWQYNRNHLISSVILLPATLCCFEIETLFGFTPDDTEVSGQRSLAKPEPCNWEFGAEDALQRNTKRMYGMCHMAVSFQFSRKSLWWRGYEMERTGERKLLVHRCSMGVSTSFCPSVAEANTKKRLTTDSRLCASIRIYWCTTTN